jgi:predicted GNAT family acetyltransferase
MKSYKEFITESQEVLDKISKAYGKKHRGANLDASYNSKTNSIRVNQVWLPPHLQGQGIGGRMFKGLRKYADRTGSTITLSQEPDKGKKAALAKFYKNQEFVANRGKYRDFSTRDTHIRHPKKK